MAQTTIVVILAFVFMLVAPSLAQSLTSPTPMYFGRNATEIQDCLKTTQEEVQTCTQEMASLSLTRQTELIGPKCCRGYYLIDEKCRPHGVTFDPFLPPVAINDRCLSIGAVPSPPSPPSSPNITPSPKTPSRPSKPKSSVPSTGKGPSAPSTPGSPTKPAPSTPSARNKPSHTKTEKGGPSGQSAPKGKATPSTAKAPSSKSAGKAPSTKSNAKPPSSSSAVPISKKTELYDVNSWQLQ